RRAILNRLIDGKLIEQQAKRSGMTVKDEEVMESIRDILKRRNVSMAEFIKVLEREGETFESYKKDIHDQMLRQRIIRREVQAKIVVSDEEIGDYYGKHREEYEGKEAVRLKQILLPLSNPSDEAARQKAREEARAMRAKIMGGEPFEVFAAKYAPTPALAEAGGDIGFVEKGHLDTEVEAVAFRLPIGEVSDVIETSRGFLIIKVTDRRGAGLKSLADVRQEIIMKIEEQKMAQRFDLWIAEVRKKAHIEIRL
ncbi:MAG: peptidyl-prolyl cis-trans isomerase, partial [Syntrophales bacterium]|nr:peptidyl-prolyl cis-trans isomerase [Syntrophales bacterium]